MSTIKSSAEDLTLNADGSGKAIKFQADGVEKASINSSGLLTSTTIDATALTGNLPAIDGSNLTGLTSSLSGLTDTTVSTSDPATDTNPSATGHLWVNKTSGECYIATDVTTDTNIWTNIGEGTEGVPPPQYVTATGPDSAAGIASGDYKYHKFTATKTGSNGFVVSNAGNVTGNNTIEYLIVAGGGGSGSDGSGGGGAGGYRSFTGGTVSVQNYDVTVGAGGAAVQNSGTNSGTNSSVFGVSSTGGGGGGWEGAAARDGGSGGGGPTWPNGASTKGDGNAGSYSPSEGNDGGLGADVGGGGRAGGGGGASAVGGAATGSNSGTGGTGSNSHSAWATIVSAGDSGYFAGGGAGGVGNYSTGAVSGGQGGGGDRSATNGSNGSNGGSGDANTGGGGAGGASLTGSGYGGSGGSGIVIIRYKYQN